MEDLDLLILERADLKISLTATELEILELLILKNQYLSGVKNYFIENGKVVCK